MENKKRISYSIAFTGCDLTFSYISTPIDMNPTRNRRRLPDPALCLTAQPLECALILSNEWLELLEALSVVFLFLKNS
jgi:hypothetical protein